MIRKVFPFLEWFDRYSLEYGRRDLLAGLTVALVLIPQSMAYAQLAGLPVHYGLYAAFLPPMIAALFGSSRQLATGPVAVVSLMTAASLEPLATLGSDSYIHYAIVLGLLVGLIQLSLGILRLGLVVNFLSHPVVNGFTNAAAIIIATSQLSKLFGVTVESSEHHYETIVAVLESAAQYTHWPTFFMGIFGFALMYALKKLAPRFPNVLVAVVITSLLSWGLGYERNQVILRSQVNDGNVLAAMNAYNGLLANLDSLAKELKEANRRADQFNSTADRLVRLKMHQEVESISASMEVKREEAGNLRNTLRSYLFRRIQDASGHVGFVLFEDVESTAADDGRTWRLKVGMKPFNQERITIMSGGAVVGAIPGGLPMPSIPSLDASIIAHLLSYAAIISLLGFMEAISIAKALAGKTGQRLDPNQELIGQGLANIFGAFGRSYPTSGSFSRSAVNYQSGAVTGMSSVFASVTVVIVLFFFTPLLYYLPESVLAAVIMMAVVGLINVSGFVHAWRAQWFDGVISIISFFCTLIFAPHLDKGIMVGVVLSLGVFLYKSMRPTMPSLARGLDMALRSAVAHGLKECNFVDLIRFDGPLFFANASYLEDKINERMKLKGSLRHIILVANGINDIDASGEEVLSLLIDNVRSAGVDLSFSGVNESVMAVLRRTYLIEKIGGDHIFPTMEKAICGVHERAHRDAVEDRCPLTAVCQIE